MLKLVKKGVCHWIVYRREESIKRLISMKRKGEVRDLLLAERAYRYKKYLCSFTKNSSVWGFD